MHVTVQQLSEGRFFHLRTGIMIDNNKHFDIVYFAYSKVIMFITVTCIYQPYLNNHQQYQHIGYHTLLSYRTELYKNYIVCIQL